MWLQHTTINGAIGGRPVVRIHKRDHFYDNGTTTAANKEAVNLMLETHYVITDFIYSALSIWGDLLPMERFLNGNS